MATYEFCFWYKGIGDTDWQVKKELIEANTDDEAIEKAKYPMGVQLPAFFRNGQLREIKEPNAKKNTLAWKPISYSR